MSSIPSIKSKMAEYGWLYSGVDGIYNFVRRKGGRKERVSMDEIIKVVEIYGLEAIDLFNTLKDIENNSKDK